ncbi:MAG: DNA glycosylase [Chloroflexi bacterium]|nr:DNA glycosylase [Chloroflexota bacterium]
MVAVTRQRDIDVPEPFDLAATLESGQVFRWRRVDSGWYVGTVGQQPVMLRQVEEGLSYRCEGGAEEAVRRALHDFLRLEDDLRAIYREVGDDPRVAEAIGRYPGLRLLRQEPWECLVSFVCSSVSNIPRISRTLEAVTRRYGKPMDLAGHTLYAFPAPEELARVGEGELRGLGLGFRARYVDAIAPAQATGIVDLAALRRASYEEAKAQLMSLPGVGEKVADCVLVFSLDKLEGFPVDRWIRRCLKEWYFQGGTISDAALLSWAQARWGWYAGYVQQYLFHDRRLAGAGTPKT